MSGRGILSGVFHATLLRGLLLSEFLEKPLYESFYKANSLKGIKVADPFMRGGTPLIEANRLGCEIAGFHIGSIAGDAGTTGKCSIPASRPGAIRTVDHPDSQ